jgi:hypothetical protein
MICLLFLSPDFDLHSGDEIAACTECDISGIQNLFFNKLLFIRRLAGYIFMSFDHHQVLNRLCNVLVAVHSLACHNPGRSNKLTKWSAISVERLKLAQINILRIASVV